MNPVLNTMLLVSIDPKMNRAAVISIPRDTKVPIKGAGDKICHANMVGGLNMQSKSPKVYWTPTSTTI